MDSYRDVLDDLLWQSRHWHSLLRRARVWTTSADRQYPPPPCISYANVHNYYGPYAYCSLDKGVACAQHIQLPTYTCAG